jgi:hypothetical protein
MRTPWARNSLRSASWEESTVTANVSDSLRRPARYTQRCQSELARRSRRASALARRRPETSGHRSNDSRETDTLSASPTAPRPASIGTTCSVSRRRIASTSSSADLPCSVHRKIDEILELCFTHTDTFKSENRIDGFATDSAIKWSAGFGQRRETNAASRKRRAGLRPGLRMVRVHGIVYIIAIAQMERKYNGGEQHNYRPPQICWNPGVVVFRRKGL